MFPPAEPVTLTVEPGDQMDTGGGGGDPPNLREPNDLVSFSVGVKLSNFWTRVRGQLQIQCWHEELAGSELDGTFLTWQRCRANAAGVRSVTSSANEPGTPRCCSSSMCRPGSPRKGSLRQGGCSRSSPEGIKHRRRAERTQTHTFGNVSGRKHTERLPTEPPSSVLLPELREASCRPLNAAF